MSASEAGATVDAKDSVGPSVGVCSASSVVSSTALATPVSTVWSRVGNARPACSEDTRVFRRLLRLFFEARGGMLPSLNDNQGNCG
jgi:hypothetical protein